MPADMIAAVRPLTDFVELIDIPLVNFLPIDGSAVLENILVSEVWTDLDDSKFRLGAEFYLGGIANLHLPGLDQFSLSFNEDALATGVLTCGDEPSLQFQDVEITLRVAPAILRAADGTGAALRTTCGVRFDRDGFHFLEFGETSLADSRIAGTDLAISLHGIHLDTAFDTFLRVRSGTLTLPMFTDAAGAPMVLAGRDLSFSRDGPSGTFERRAGPALALNLYGFACVIEDASLVLADGQLTEVALGGRIDLKKFLAHGREDGWVKVSFSIGPGGLVASLSDDDPIVDMAVDRMFQLSVNTIRLEAGAPGTDGVLWLSGSLTPEIENVEGGWPSFDFDEIGVGPKGGLRLGDGTTIATTQPFVLSWNFLKLTVTAFSLQRPDDAPADLELRITAAVEIVAGLPAGASVDGLVVRRRTNGDVSARFDGIGISFATPGGYSFEASISWDSTRRALSGTGHLDVPSLDMRLDVVVAAASESVDGRPVTTFFLAAEAELVPGGIPIGTTGLSLYGVSGLLAHNLALKLPNAGPRRFFDAFMEAPKGSFAARSKWEVSNGAHALGFGVVIGTADDGWLFSARGALMVSIPDLSILLTATGEILHERQPMNANGEGKLAALLAIYPAQQLLRLDFSAQWECEGLFEVQGAGGGEFHGNRPLDFKVWLGEEGTPVAARALKFDSKWLFNAEYWLGLNAGRKANIGLRTRLDLRAGIDGLYAELVGQAGGQLTLAWNPSQFEGDFLASGRARLVAGGLSLGFGLSAGIDARVAKPTLLEIPLRSCIEIDLGFDSFELCLTHTFRWRNEDAPELSPMVHGLSAVPRHWAPRVQASPETPIDDGIVHHVSDVDLKTIDLGLVAPHSELVLELSKCMFVAPAVKATAKLNDVATPYPQEIGRKSGWLAKWSIEKLELHDSTLGAPVDLFGTFSRSPLDRTHTGKTARARLPNTELRLLSSRRYGQGGSLGGGGGEDIPPTDCTVKPTRVRKCVSLAELETDFGLLPNGWLYQWSAYPEFPRRRDNRYGVGLGGEDSFRFWPPLGIDAVNLVSAEYVSRQPPVAGTERTDAYPVTNPDPVNFHDRRRILLTLCWEELIADVGSGEPQDWQGSSGSEEWTLAPEQRLLIPNHRYELTVQMEGQLQRGTHSVNAPLAMARTYVFTADRAPDWKGGLSRAIASHYPDDGQRPVYRHYDLFVHFKDDFFNALYTLDKRRLGVRLRGTDGELVASATGEVFLPTAWETGAVARAPVEDWWLRGRAGNSAESCEATTPLPKDDGEILLPITLKDLNLRPEARYLAELVAVDAGAAPTNPTQPLAEWSFTTSRFETFADMMEPPRHVPSFALAVTEQPVDTNFDTLIRALGAPAVGVVENVRMTPARVGSRFVYLLIEAPEPLDDDAGRLSVTIDAQPARCMFNLDKTRAIAALAAPLALGLPGQVVAVTLVWERAPLGATREMQRAVAGDTGPETVTWRVPLMGLFG